MPLHPEVAAMLEQFAAQAAPPLHTLTPQEARQLPRPKIEPEPIAFVDNKEIAGPGGPIPIRIYRPEGTGPFPVLVYFHGGGWVINNLDTHDHVCRALTKGAECAVVSVGYRKAPEHKFPAALEDAYAATKWAAEHANKIKGDPQRIAVGGDSAGGNLAAAVALMSRNHGPKLCYQLLAYPVTNYDFTTESYAENADGYYLTRDSMQWFWRHYLPDEDQGTNPLASPLRASDLSSLPPALILTAEYDPLRDEGEAYAKRLKEAGVSVTAKRYDGLVHAFFSHAPFLPVGRKALEEAAEHLRTAFTGD